MEVSSHALAWKSVRSPLPHSIFTNLTRDHLDFHSRWRSTFAAKSDSCLKGAGGSTARFTVLNRDDEYAAAFPPRPYRSVVYGLGSEAARACL